MEYPLNIYITAHTLISSLGFGISENKKAIHDYRSGIRMQEAGRISDSPILAGMIDSVELEKRAKEQLEKRAKELDISSYTRLEQLFILTIQEVISQSGVNLQELDCALLLSTTKGNIDLLSDQEKRTNSDKPSDSVQSTIDNSSFLQELSVDSPAFLWKMAERIGNFFEAANQVEVISNACISGVSALVVAKRWIELGRYKRVIVAGGDILSHFITSGFLSFRSVSAHRCRPYDIQRDGLSLGEACGAVLLETQGNINHIILSGGAISNDANHISGPSRTGDGLALAINQAMEEAGALPEDISFINAHGTATVYNDEMESKAIHLAGLSAVPVNSLKPYFGHTLGASGIIETILCIEQLKEGIYYGTLGYETLGVPMPITVYGTHQPMPMKCCIKTASGFGGCNAALVLSLPDAHLKQKIDSPASCKAAVESANTVTIKPGVVESQGTAIVNSPETDFAPFIREAYKHLGENNMKFYKMDNLCKLGYVAAGYLLKDTNYRPEEVGIILANASASLDTDCRHQAIINKKGDKAASPAVFVYTLPNVVLGEICIRHKIQGENTFFVCQQSDVASLEDYARIVMAKGKLRTCIIGWCELLDGHYQAEFKQLNNISTIYE
ncbi:beta-ketoacyl synthase N-terminal-like domain-containing protein [Bacteroides xylanisolvens]|uniref:beta-ketoacyl synthase N-terminal-like domain-containing protein n=1 Tax=Bacteroides xylanisolvens TaxID=371601 RepID=UPI0023076471|nr:beta-ketoacyl synthase N-terminal-like domain-containing protein [Bacteroides xylanisolvens]MDB0715215.1 beta-ketoacyl synthase N-terminal-like domain-containing protein [Bacteroides xylanisolvens]MDB0735193.1 beta-ketoacyl synthase N-terminal-like domain-containing protein [Bacteroides xylanisolvens]